MKCKKNHECGIRPIYDWECEGEPGKLVGDYCPECEEERRILAISKKSGEDVK